MKNLDLRVLEGHLEGPVNFFESPRHGGRGPLQHKRGKDEDDPEPERKEVGLGHGVELENCVENGPEATDHEHDHRARYQHSKQAVQEEKNTFRSLKCNFSKN